MSNVLVNAPETQPAGRMRFQTVLSSSGVSTEQIQLLDKKLDEVIKHCTKTLMKELKTMLLENVVTKPTPCKAFAECLTVLHKEVPAKEKFHVLDIINDLFHHIKFVAETVNPSFNEAIKPQLRTMYANMDKGKDNLSTQQQSQATRYLTLWLKKQYLNYGTIFDLCANANIDISTVTKPLEDDPFIKTTSQSGVVDLPIDDDMDATRDKTNVPGLAEDMLWNAGNVSSDKNIFNATLVGENATLRAIAEQNQNLPEWHGDWNDEWHDLPATCLFPPNTKLSRPIDSKTIHPLPLPAGPPKPLVRSAVDNLLAFKKQLGSKEDSGFTLGPVDNLGNPMVGNKETGKLETPYNQWGNPKWLTDKLKNDMIEGFQPTDVYGNAFDLSTGSHIPTPSQQARIDEHRTMYRASPPNAPRGMFGAASIPAGPLGIGGASARFTAAGPVDKMAAVNSFPPPPSLLAGSSRSLQGSLNAQDNFPGLGHNRQGR